MKRMMSHAAAARCFIRDASKRGRSAAARSYCRIVLEEGHANGRQCCAGALPWRAVGGGHLAVGIEREPHAVKQHVSGLDATPARSQGPLREKSARHSVSGKRDACSCAVEVKDHKGHAHGHPRTKGIRTHGRRAHPVVAVKDRIANDALPQKKKPPIRRGGKAGIIDKAIVSAEKVLTTKCGVALARNRGHRVCIPQRGAEASAYAVGMAVGIGKATAICGPDFSRPHLCCRVYSAHGCNNISSNVAGVVEELVVKDIEVGDLNVLQRVEEGGEEGV